MMNHKVMNSQLQQNLYLLFLRLLHHEAVVSLSGTDAEASAACDPPKQQ